MNNQNFRKSMSQFTTGVTAVTGKYNGEIMGMTVNAFMSISLDPQLIAISIDEKAGMYDKLLEEKTFGLSILKKEQKNVSQIFAKQIEEDQEINYSIQDGVPVVDDSLAMLSCRVQDTVKAGDHMIFIAEVTDISLNEGEPLLYFDSNYRSIEQNK